MKIQLRKLKSWTNNKKVMTADELYTSCLDYFEENELYTINALCNHLGITQQTLANYGKESNEYGEIVEWAKNIIVHAYHENTLNGKYPPSYTMFLLKNTYGFRDKIETENDNTHKIVIERVDLNGDS